MMVLLLLILLILGYYGKLVVKLNQNNETEKQVIEDIKQMFILQEDTGNVSIQNGVPETVMSPIENVEDSTQANSIIPLKAENVQETLPKGFDCIISIPSISLEKIVYTGDSREEHLEQYDLITSADDMQYSNGGNYIICGHYSQLYGHSLNRLKDVSKGDYVYINSNDELHKYKVYSKTFETMTDTSSFCIQTEQRELTVISCAKYIGVDKYIVIKCELIN